MRLDKRNNVKRGIKYGIINKTITLLLPFLVQTIMINSLGAEYVGIKGLYSSILTVLSLSELGVGTAIVYSMYRPVAEDDYKTIGALLCLYRKLYVVIGFVVLFVGLAITPFLKYLIKGEYPGDINIYVIFLLYLANTVVSYWVFAYKSSILNAYQRIDVISNVETAVQIITCFFQIVFLLKIKNFYLFLIISIVSTVIKNYIISIYVDRMYPNIKSTGEISKKIKLDMKINTAGLLIEKVCGTTRNTFDNIFVSMFMGLTQAAIYSNYYYVLLALNGFTKIVLDSLLAGVGNSIIIDSKEENYKQMMILHTAYMIITGWMAICMLCLYQPFMRLWVGKGLLFSENVMLLFPLYFYIEKLGDIRGVYSDGAGLFWQNRKRTLIESVANITLNYLFVLKWGAFGIMLATIITLFFIGFIGSTIVIFRYYFNTGMREYLCNSIFYLFVTVLVGIFSYSVCGQFNISSAILSLLVRGGWCVLAVPIVYFMLVFYRNDFKEMLNWTKIVWKKMQ